MSKKIFISHAAKDKEIADAFVDVILHGALSVPITEIFCVSTDGTKIKSGKDWRDSIKDNILNAKINFLLISPNYKESEVCMNEMGAAWMTNSIVIPLIIDPINYKTVGVIQQPNQIEKLLDENSLDRIKDIVQEELNISPSLIKSDRWTVKKKEFLLRINKRISNNPFDTPMDRIAFKQLLQEKIDLEQTLESLIEEKAALEVLVSELERTKDKSEVASVLKKHKKGSQFEEFQVLCKEVSSLLNAQPAIINGLIFRSYSNKKDIPIRGEFYGDELGEAIANDYIDEEWDVKWRATDEMIEIREALDKVRAFIEIDHGSSFDDSFNEHYNSPPWDIDNKKFWENVFDANITFN